MIKPATKYMARKFTTYPTPQQRRMTANLVRSANAAQRVANVALDKLSNGEVDLELDLAHPLAQAAGRRVHAALNAAISAVAALDCELDRFKDVCDAVLLAHEIDGRMDENSRRAAAVEMAR